MQERCVPLLGMKTIEELRKSHICIFGVGGVGGFVCESLARMGVGEFTIVDFDTVAISNINRQIIALTSTIGQKKVDVMKGRIEDINPNAIIHIKDTFVTKENMNEFNFEDYTYVIDCIDNVTAKLEIIQNCKIKNVPIISSMGTGNKLDPMQFKIADISKTTVCPLARVIRLELRKRDIKGVKVLYSTEEAKKSEEFISSVSFVPSIAGLLIAREVILDIHSKVLNKE